MTEFRFTFEALRDQFKRIQSLGYQVVTCEEYRQSKKVLAHQKVLVNRIDIDFSVKKAEKLGEIFNDLNIKGTFFLRLHAPEYNPFSFENYRIIKDLVSSGHELGYHSEIIDQASIWGEEAADNLKRDIRVLDSMFGVQVKGVASHGGMTGLNNLDFWKTRKPCEFGLLYEAYDKQPEYNLFQEALYISDSEWTRWKCYNKGDLVAGDRRSPAEHAEEGHSLIYLLLHPETYFHRHFYE